MDAHPRCSAIRADGTPCTLAPVRGGPYCFAHALGHAERAARGGRNSRRALHSVDGQSLPSVLRPYLTLLGRAFRRVESG